MRLEWTCELPAPPLGLSLAREANSLLVFDAERFFTRIDRRGQVQLRRACPATVVAASISDEGRHVAALGRRGQVWLLSGEFDVIWQRSLTHRPLAVAVDHLGKTVAVSDDSGGLSAFDLFGQELWRATTPRPLIHLAFVPERGALVGAADLGLVCAFDQRGRALWREGLMTNIGSLSVSGDGGRIALACFSEGVNVCSLDRSRPEPLGRELACKFACVGYRGEPMLCVGIDGKLGLLDGAGKPLADWLPPGNPSAVVLGALGDWAAVALPRLVLGIGHDGFDKARTA